MKNKNTIIILSLNICLLIYIIIIGVIGYLYNWKATIMGAVCDVWILNITMFIFELLSTLTFQLRIWLTSKNKIRTAALIGATSWLIAGFEGLLLINGSITPLIEVATFFIKIPPVFVATFSGILINSYFYKKSGDKNV